MANATTTDLFTEHVGNYQSNSEPATMANAIMIDLFTECVDDCASQSEPATKWHIRFFIMH